MRTIDDEIHFLVHDTLTGSDAPKVKYLDRPSTGADTEIHSQEDTPTHSGNVTFDKEEYEVGDTVLITAIDKDLNENNDTIDIFTIVSPISFPFDPAVETIGEEDLGKYADGSPFGRLLEIRFDDELWATSNLDFISPPGPDCGTPGMPNDGFFSTGTTLVETERSSGVFLSDFQLPATYCSRDFGGNTIPVNGTTIWVTLFDFRDAFGFVTEVNDIASIPNGINIDAFVSMGTGNAIPSTELVKIAVDLPEDGSIATADFETGLLTQKSDSLTSVSLDGIAFKDDGRLFATNSTHLFEVNATTGDLNSATRMTHFFDGIPFSEQVIDLTADAGGINSLDILSWNGTQFTFNILLEDGRVFPTGLSSRCDQQVGSIAWNTPETIIFTFIPKTFDCEAEEAALPLLVTEDMEEQMGQIITTDESVFLVERQVIRGLPPLLGPATIWSIGEFYDGLGVNGGQIFATSENGIHELDCSGETVGVCTSSLVAGNGTNPDDVDFLP